jgi:peptidoglycan/xylan/chitin deacetylase (PgdA/CDA1 family)
MRRVVSVFIVALLISGAGMIGSLQAQSKRIAVTFDELPAAQTFVPFNKAEMTSQILAALAKYQVSATGFVVGERIASDPDLIGQWLNGGHKLGNMTMSNQDFNDVGVSGFMREVRQGYDALEEILGRFGQKKRYFRFPYLHYGPTAQAKTQVREYLESGHTVIAHVTVISEDFLYNLRLEQLGPHPDTGKISQLRVEYIVHVLEELGRQEELALQIAGHPVAQIIQLRANRLNALCIDELLGEIKGRGYKFVTLDDALADPAYTITENYAGDRGVGYLDMAALSRKKK